MTDKETLGDDQGGTEDLTSHRQFIADYWHELSAMALHGYQPEGRGAVLIASDNIALGVGKAVYVSHASLDHLEYATGSRWPSDEIEQQIIVVVMRQDGGANCYRVMRVTQPRDASVIRLN